jgi:hypothetical protein
MKISIDKFQRILHSRKVPYYAFPRTDKFDTLTEIYKITPITAHRTIKIGATYKDKHLRFNSVVQKAVLNKLLTLKPPYPPYVIGISSVPNDVLALEVAGYINYALVSNNNALRWLWWNSYKYVMHQDDNDMDVLFLHNITPYKSDRSQRIRDILTHFNNSLRIVVIAGTDALDYFDNFLHSGLSALIHITGTTDKYAVKQQSFKKESFREAGELSLDLFSFLGDIGKSLRDED